MILIEALAESLEHDPAPAVCFGTQRVARLELAARAEALRRELLARGVVPGDRVALLCPNHPAFPVAWLAVLAAGATLVPLNPLFQPGELEALLRDAAPRLLLTLDLTAPLAAASLEHLSGAARPDVLVLEDPDPEPAMLRALRAGLRLPARSASSPASGSASSPRPWDAWPRHRLEGDGQLHLTLEPLPADAPAVLIYTSGTTGTPRAAVLSHANLEHNARFIARTWFGGESRPLEGAGRFRAPAGADGDRHRVLAALPLCHNFGLNVTLDATLLHGGTLVLLPRFSAVEVWRAIEAHGVSALPLVPAMTQALLTNPERARVDSSSLRLLISGGAALPGPLREGVLERYPALTLIDTYGLSEASLVACTRPGTGTGKPGTVGRPVDDTELEIVDAEGRPCPPGEVGEIRVRGPGVMRGYWRQVSEAVLEGWLYTGDLGQLDADGDLTVVDRKKDLIIHGGYKVYPLEVEEVLYRHPAVAEAAVYGVPDGRMGERVAACVALHPEQEVDAAALIAHCRRQLAEFKVPASIELRAALPRGSTGKILRRALREEAGRVS